MRKYKTAANEHYNNIKDSLKESALASNKELYDNVQAILQGEYTVCTGWEQVERLLECFDNNDDWDIRQAGNVFFVLADTASTKEKNLFDKVCREEGARG